MKKAYSLNKLRNIGLNNACRSFYYRPEVYPLWNVGHSEKRTYFVGALGPYAIRKKDI